MTDGGYMKLVEMVKTGVLPPTGRSITLKDATGFTLAWGETPPDDSGYAVGCVFVNSKTGEKLVNIGTLDQANFTSQPQV